MKTRPYPVRFESDLVALLHEGVRRTPHRKQDLIRLTLRRHLRDVIEAEAKAKSPDRVTNIEPWPKGALTRAYNRTAAEKWDKIEDAATRAQATPDFND